MKKITFLLISTILLISCSDKNKTENSSQTTEVKENSISNEIFLKGNDEMKFDKTKFTVNAGQEVKLTFTNEGVLPLETMGHNVVILEKNTDVAQFANASAKAKETNYISDLYITDIVAQTKLLGPGESETIKFTLKEAGEYTFVCTFPGHWIAMKGTITAI